MQHPGPQHKPSRSGAAQVGRGARSADRQRLGYASLLSAALHVGAAALALATIPFWRCAPEQLGSAEVELDPDAPRLAAPLAGAAPRTPGEGGGDSTSPTPGPRARAGTPQGGQGQAARGQGEAVAQQVVAAAPHDRLTCAAPRQVGALAPGAEQSRAQSPTGAEQPPRRDRLAQQARTKQLPAQARVERKGAAQPIIARPPSAERLAPATEAAVADESRPALGEKAARGPLGADGLSAARARRPRAAPQVHRVFGGELPIAAPPVAVLASVQREVAQRAQLNRDARHAQQRQEAVADRRLAALNAAARYHRVEEGSALGYYGSGPGALLPAGHGSGGEGPGGHRGRRDARYGLRFYLDGRAVKATRVVKPPEALELPRIQCRVGRVDITPAMVRLLVVKSGRVGVSYLKHSSSSSEFDTCALRHARAIRFRPGEDEAGAPLDVWINVRVEPSFLSVSSL